MMNILIFIVIFKNIDMIELNLNIYLNYYYIKKY